MRLTPNSQPGLRPYQFTLARLVSWVVGAAGICFLIRNVVLVVVVGESFIPALLIWAFVAAMGLVGGLWRRFWDTLPGRLLLRLMFLLVVIPFSPLLLFCLDWERLIEHWRLFFDKRH